MCLDNVRVDYQPEGGSQMMYTVDNATATSATFSNLQCNTQYTISVYASGSGIGTRSVTTVVSLQRGIVVTSIIFVTILGISHTINYYPSSPSHSH